MKELSPRKPKNLVFRIRKRHYDDIVAGKQKVEYRKFSLYWLRRLTAIGPKNAVFVCGKRVHRRKILDAVVVQTPSNFSEQGKKDVPTEICFAIQLGEEIK